MPDDHIIDEGDDGDNFYVIDRQVNCRDHFIIRLGSLLGRDICPRSASINDCPSDLVTGFLIAYTMHNNCLYNPRLRRCCVIDCHPKALLYNNA